MRKSMVFTLGLMSALVVGCGPTPDANKKAESNSGAPAKSGDHAHGKGPNGGVVIDLGKYHAEFTVDHNKKECTILILGSDEKTPLPVAAKDLTVTIKATKTKEGKDVPAMTVKMVPRDEAGGKASKYVGTDPALGNVADFEGTVSGEVEGKPAAGDFKE